MTTCTECGAAFDPMTEGYCVRGQAHLCGACDVDVLSDRGAASLEQLTWTHAEMSRAIESFDAGR